MCWSSLLVEYLVEERLAEARAAAAQHSLLRSLPPPGQRQGPTLRARLAEIGQRLAEIGQRLLRSSRIEAPASATVRPERVVPETHPTPIPKNEDWGERAA